ncbi:hypothetical protein ACJX0J_026771 [Zea mays]
MVTSVESVKNLRDATKEIIVFFGDQHKTFCHFAALALNLMEKFQKYLGEYSVYMICYVASIEVTIREASSGRIITSLGDTIVVDWIALVFFSHNFLLLLFF